MLRRASLLLLAVSGLALVGCESQPGTSRQSREPDLTMPRRTRVAQTDEEEDEWNRRRAAAQASYGPVETYPRADDSLPGAYQDLSGRARSVGERIASTADTILVEKSAHRLTLYRGNSVLASFPVGLGEAYGDKQRQGDRRTPEGEYFITDRKGPGETNFHRAFLINYPNERDRLEGKTGGMIEIHGLGPYTPILGNNHYMTPWTAGCMGLTDAQMDQIWDAVPLGTRVVIRA